MKWKHIARRALLGFAALALAGCAAAPAVSTAAPGARTTFAAASPAEGAAILSANDEYLSVLSASDLSIRLHGAPGTSADLGRLYAGATLAWSEADTRRLREMVSRHRADLDAIAPWLPETVYFIKGGEAIEGGIPHTRGAAIFFGGALPEGDARLDQLFLHELFHVLSRHSAARHDELYGVIGFAPCDAVLPADTASRLITNPDAPHVGHAAPLSASDQSLLATPLLIAEPARYDPAKPNLGQYFTVVLTPMRRGGDGKCRPAEGVNLSQAQIRDAIFAAAGRNTNYLFHPEEIMADNFAQMMLRETAPDAWVHERLARLLGVSR